MKVEEPSRGARCVEEWRGSLAPSGFLFFKALTRTSYTASLLGFGSGLWTASVYGPWIVVWAYFLRLV